MAQNDQNLEAEWALSSFDRRHQLSSDLSFELPFGPNKHWLHNGGTAGRDLRPLARLGRTSSWQSGTPLTPRDPGRGGRRRPRHQRHAARRTTRRRRSGLRARRIDRFFNTAAFAVPLPGTFGSASRNMIIGPGSRLLNAQFSRDVQMQRNRGLTIQVTANNLLNGVNYTRVDTTRQLADVRTGPRRVRPMRSAQLNLRFRF